MREIKVKGIKTLKLTPNWVNIDIDIRVSDMDYDQMMSTFEYKMERLMDVIVQSNYDESDLKTANFTIETLYNYVNNERVFGGYQIKQQLVLGLPFDKEDVNHIVRVLSLSNVQPELSLNFTIKEDGEVEAALLEGAVNHAKEKATILANAANVRLGEVFLVDELTSPPIGRRIMPKAYGLEHAALAISPSDLEVTKEVIVTWSIAE